MNDLKKILLVLFVSLFFVCVGFVGFVAYAASDWSQQQKITPDDGAAGEYFSNYWGGTNGESVTVDSTGTYAVVGAEDEDKAYVFKRSGATWAQVDMLTGPSSSSFGRSVDISGDYMIIGAPSDNRSYIYKRDTGLDTWSITEYITSPHAGDFGWSVGIDGDYAVVGGPNYSPTIPQRLGQGGIEIYKRDTGLESWTVQTGVMATWYPLAADDDEANAYVGYTVDIDGDTVVAGAPGEDNTKGVNAGSVYVFTRSGETWSQQQKLEPALSSEMGMGTSSIAVSGDYFIATHYGPNVYVYYRLGDTWSHQQTITPGTGTYGTSVDLNGSYAIIGEADTLNPAYNGAAYIYQRSGSTWSQLGSTLIASDGEAEDNFGCGVAINSNNYALIGAAFDDDNGIDAGAAYIFNYAEVTNAAPVVTNVIPATPSHQSTDGLGTITFDFSVEETDVADTSEITIEYTTNGTNWYRAYIDSATPSAEGPLTITNGAHDSTAGQFSVDTAGGTKDITVTWDSKYSTPSYTYIGADLSTVQVKVTADDGTDTASDSSSTFTVNNQMPYGTFVIQSSTDGTNTSTSSLIEDIDLSAITGATEMKFSNDGITYTAYEAYAVTKSSWDMSNATYGGDSTEGTKTVYAIFKDDFGNESSAITDTITYSTNDAPTIDTTPELVSQTTDGLGKVTFTVGVADANDNPLEVKVDYTTDAGVSWNRTYLDSVTPSYGATPTITNGDFDETAGQFSAVDTSSGENTLTIVWDSQNATPDYVPITAEPETVQIMVTVDDGTVTADDTSLVFTVDNQAPSGVTAIQSTTDAAGGTTFTSSLTEDVDLSAITGASEMKFSNDGITYSAYEAYGATKASWDFSDVAYGGDSSEGTKTVYAIFKDALGNESSVITDNIIYDTTAPTNPDGAIDGQGAVDDTWSNTNDDPDFTSFTNEFDTNGIYQYYWYFDTSATGVTTDSILTDAVDPSSLAESGERYLRVITQDLAGNWADPDGGSDTCTNTNVDRPADSDCWATIFTHKFDEDAPNTPAPSSSPTSWTNSNSFEFSWSDPGDVGGSGIANYTYETDAGTASTTTPDDTTLDVTLSSDADGTKLFEVFATDNASNNGLTGSVNFYYDSVDPINAGTVTDSNGSLDDTWATIADPDFVWTSGTDVGGSGVDEYDVYWGTEIASTTPTATVSSPAYDAAAAPLPNTPYYLRINTRDTAGNISGWETKYTFKFSQQPANPPSLSQTATQEDLTEAALTMGEWTGDTTPTLNFTLTDPDGDSLGYIIYVDDDDDFSSPVVHYTYGANDIVSGTTQGFTVGQAADTGGAYTIGAESQTLAAGDYYWKVQAVENHGLTSSEVIANSGSVAFQLDTTDPDISAVILSSTGTTTSSVGLSIDGTPTDGDSGMHVTPYKFTNLTKGTDSGWQAVTTWTSTGLTSSSPHIFKITVRDASGNTTDSATIGAVTADAPPAIISSGGSIGPPVTPPAVDDDDDENEEEEEEDLDDVVDVDEEEVSENEEDILQNALDQINDLPYGEPVIIDPEIVEDAEEEPEEEFQEEIVSAMDEYLDRELEKNNPDFSVDMPQEEKVKFFLKYLEVLQDTRMALAEQKYEDVSEKLEIKYLEKHFKTGLSKEFLEQVTKGKKHIKVLQGDEILEISDIEEVEIIIQTDEKYEEKKTAADEAGKTVIIINENTNLDGCTEKRCKPSDEDTINDMWQISHGLPLFNPDPDEDGRTNADEIFFGTDPLVADEVFEEELPEDENDEETVYLKYSAKITNLDAVSYGNTPVFRLAGEPDDKVSIYVAPINDSSSKTFLGETVIGDDGKGEILSWQGLEDGEYFIVVTDDENEEVESIDVFEVKNDSSTNIEYLKFSENDKLLVFIAMLLENVELIVDDFDKEEFIAIRTPGSNTIKGRAAPGSTVYVSFKSLVISSVVISDASQGEFNIDIPKRLAVGEHDLTAYVMDERESVVGSARTVKIRK
ncbi:hypothetical protein HON58_03830 [Candidatus Peregrinibacteria bacterium]|nr:hypothetical protein [Candidatus Peregrinibacteria bacterium]